MAASSDALKQMLSQGRVPTSSANVSPHCLPATGMPMHAKANTANPSYLFILPGDIGHLPAQQVCGRTPFAILPFCQQLKCFCRQPCRDALSLGIRHPCAALHLPGVC